jgi:flavin-dependent dehydrogenase
MTIVPPFSMRSSADVLIIGAGPVGLLLACELHRREVDYLLIERSPQRSYFCKALGVTPARWNSFLRSIWQRKPLIAASGSLAGPILRTA